MHLSCICASKFALGRRPITAIKQTPNQLLNRSPTSQCCGKEWGCACVAQKNHERDAASAEQMAPCLLFTKSSALAGAAQEKLRASDLELCLVGRDLSWSLY